MNLQCLHLHLSIFCSFCLQESSDEDGKDFKVVPEAFGSKANVRVSVVSQDSESKDGESEESVDETSKHSDKEKTWKGGRKKRLSEPSSVGNNAEKDLKSDKEKLKAGVMSNSKKVRYYI